MEQDDRDDGILQVRPGSIQSNVDDLMKGLNEHCKIYELLSQFPWFAYSRCPIRKSPWSSYNEEETKEEIKRCSKKKKRDQTRAYLKDVVLNRHETSVLANSWVAVSSMVRQRPQLLLFVVLALTSAQVRGYIDVMDLADGHIAAACSSEAFYQRGYRLPE
nr:hypothetical protein CFP56_46993 [Quercus suber]